MHFIHRNAQFIISRIKQMALKILFGDNFQQTVRGLYFQMGKKDQKEEKNQPKSKSIRSSLKPKNKEMFIELKTHEENKITKSRHIQPNLKKNNIKQEYQMEEQSMSEQYNENVDVKTAKNFEEISIAVHQLIAKNKINTKNAFEIPLVDLEKLSVFQNITEADNGWKKLSSTLENDSKIYSYRVDAIHSIAYRIMNTMARNKDDEEQNIKKQAQKNKMNELDELRAFPLYEGIEMSTSQLQKNIESLNAQNLSLALDFNPNFQRNKRKFDQAGIKSMLMNTIGIDTNIQLSLNESRNQDQEWQKKEQFAVKVDELHEPLNIFREIQYIRKDVCEIAGESFQFLKNFEGTWRKVKAGDFQKYQSEEKMEEENPQVEAHENDYGVYKKVQDTIKMKAGKKKVFPKTAAEFAQTEKNWLTQVDKKMLGIKTSGPTPAMFSKKALKIEKNEEDIDFEGPELKRQQVLVEWQKAEEKSQQQEEIEDRHLLPPKPFNKFKVEQILSLREEPLEEIEEKYEQQENDETIQQQKEQVDLRRQQLSIKQSKDVIKGMISKRSSFRDIMKGLCQTEHSISQELCFLTILHLANENNLTLQQSGEKNFIIA